VLGVLNNVENPNTSKYDPIAKTSFVEVDELFDILPPAHRTLI